MKAALRPLPATRQVSPASPDFHTPPQEMAMVTLRLSRGSTRIEWGAGRSVPPPIHCLRSGRS